jgi:hypothetical protein
MRIRVGSTTGAGHRILIFVRISFTVSALALGSSLVACASVAGLDGYSADCGEGCVDATSTDVGPGSPGPDAGQGREGGDGSTEDASDAVAGDGSCDGGSCPATLSEGVTWACAHGSCNSAGGACTSNGQGCYCTSDSSCKSGKCVKTAGQNDSSCTSCSGSGPADGFDCQLGSPGVAASCASTFSYTPSNLTAAQLSALAPVSPVDLSCSGIVTFDGSAWSGATCSQTLPSPKVVPQTRGPSIDVLAFQALTIGSGVTLKLTGSNAVMIVVVGDATVLGAIHADGAAGASNSTSSGASGPGGNYDCGSSKGGAGGAGHTSGGGGGGAGTAGGTGGDGVGGNGGAAGTTFGASAESPLHGGCPGGNSGSWACTTSGGGGGGAVQISAAGTLTVTGTITASGGAGGTSACASAGCAPGPNHTYGGGAGGGGSGGTIVLEGASLTTTGSALTPGGGTGGDPDPALQEMGAGGAGAASSSQAGAAGTGSISNGCGADDESGAGGGGGYGYLSSAVRSSQAASCFCVADSQCSTGACVGSGQCTGTCTGTGAPDLTNCVLVTATPTSYACPTGSCSDIGSPAGGCAAAGVACWCASDGQCESGACVGWAGCAVGACSGSGPADSFHCAP